MLKRTLVFTNAMDLTLKNKQIVIAYKDKPNEATTVPIEDVGTVVLEHLQTSVSLPLLNALVDGEVQVVLCNEKFMPNSLLLGMDTNSLQGEVLRNQMNCGEVLKKQLWKQIVEAKIRNQALLLDKICMDGDVLKPYYTNVKSGDTDNREGIAARIYFQHLFGPDFIRDRSMPGTNVLLNYGYAILRSSVARALVSSGLFPAFGIYHHNRSNAFPLADDVMEPYRPYVDEIVYDIIMSGETELTKEVKAKLVGLLYVDTVFEKVIRPLSVGISITTASLAKCYAKEQNEITLPMLQ